MTLIGKFSCFIYFQLEFQISKFVTAWLAILSSYLFTFIHQYILQAKMLIGSTLLVTKDNRPELEEGEFYTSDLVGMKVFMKVGTCYESYFLYIQTYVIAVLLIIYFLLC